MEKHRREDIITRKRLKAMCRYFRNKTVDISYEYASSICDPWVRKKTISYDSFTIESIGISGFEEFSVSFLKDEAVEFHQEFPGHCSSYFYGLGRIEWNTSGPCCRFTIKHSGILQRVCASLLRLAP